MNNEKLALISEFDHHSSAERAGLRLKELGFDMGNVRVVGANWLNSVDASGNKTPGEASRLGMLIAVPICTILGLIVGLIHGAGALPGHRLTGIVLPTIGMAALGAILGALLGHLFGFVEHDVETPVWAESEYGNKLREGSFLLLVRGDSKLIDRAKKVVAGLSPISIRVRAAKD